MHSWNLPKTQKNHLHFRLFEVYLLAKNANGNAFEIEALAFLGDWSKIKEREKWDNLKSMKLNFIDFTANKVGTRLD